MIKKLFQFVAVFCFLYSFNVYANKISVRADVWCPYNCNPTDENPGYMIEILRKAFGNENIDYQTTAWARAVLDTRDGKFDAIVGASAEDASDFVLSDQMGVSASCFFVKKDKSNFKYTGIDSLNSIKLGVVKDYAYFEKLDSYIKTHIADKNKIDEHFGDQVQKKMIQKLDMGRIDAFVEDANVTGYALKSMPEVKDVVEAGCGDPVKLYIAFSPKDKKKSEELKAKFNTALKKMKDSGELKDILTKYSIKPW